MMTTELDDVAGELRLSVGRLARRLRQLYAQGNKFDGNSFLEIAVLHRLHRDGPSSPTILADAENVTTQAISAALASLDRAGLVSRRPAPADSRGVQVAVTAAGTSSLNAGNDTITRRIGEVLSDGFTAQERHHLARSVPLLERLAHEL